MAFAVLMAVWRQDALIWLHSHPQYTLQTFFSCCRFGLESRHRGGQACWLFTSSGPPVGSGSNEGAWHIAGLPRLATQWCQAGSQLCASGDGSVGASGWLLEARTIKRKVGPEEALQWRSLKPTPVPPRDWGAAGIFRLAGLWWRPSGKTLVLWLYSSGRRVSWRS